MAETRAEPVRGWLEVDRVTKVFRRSLAAGADPAADGEADLDDPGEEDEPAERESGGKALDDVSFTVEPGERVALVGATGSGKTALLNLIAGVDLPTAGEIRGSGTRLPLYDVKTPVSVTRTAKQNLILLETLLNLPAGSIRDRLDEIATFAEMTDLMNVKVAKMPRPLYSRLAVAAGLMARPDILLVDRTPVAGDIAFRSRLLDLFHETVESGTTIIMAADRAGAVRDICTRAIWLADGKILADGRADVILDRYADVMASDRIDREDILAAAEEALRLIGAQAAEPEEETSDERGGNYVEFRQWQHRQDLIEERWKVYRERQARGRLVKRSFRSNVNKIRQAGLIDVQALELSDSGGHLVNVVLPGEDLECNLRMEVLQVPCEIAVRLEVDVKGLLLLVSFLPAPIAPDKPGPYRLSFTLAGQMHSGLTEDQLFKIRSRVFTRAAPDAEWSELQVATAWFTVRGRERSNFEAGCLAVGHISGLLLDSLPPLLPGMTPPPGRNGGPPPTAREPVLKTQLNWRLYAAADDANDNDREGVGDGDGT